MFHYLTRKAVNDRLRLERRSSFRLIPCADTANCNGLINSDKLLTLINRVRVNCPILLSIPHDFATLDELVDALKDTGISRAQLFRWTRRKRDPLPHIKFNSHTIRYSLRICDEWLSKRAINV